MYTMKLQKKVVFGIYLRPEIPITTNIIRPVTYLTYFQVIVARFRLSTFMQPGPNVIDGITPKKYLRYFCENWNLLPGYKVQSRMLSVVNIFSSLEFERRSFTDILPINVFTL